ncbi:MAG: CRISPR-associated protein Csb2, partial [Actinomycetota bacterium]|nr:CRISPR-associated protein Csb2 [Actinomycetota bacterium]
GEVQLVYRPTETKPWGATPDRWRQASTRWVTATPVVLDRFPDSPDADDVEHVVRISLRTVGLPDPIDVETSRQPLLPGAVRLRPADLPRRARGRLFRHVAVTFDRPVAGPVLVGAGRYLGVGLLAPVRVRRNHA